jgi:Tol biopolymer transport system component
MSIARRLIIIIAGLGTLWGVACREAPAPLPLALRLTLSHSAELVIDSGPDALFGLALAPDGRRLVFAARSEGDAVGQLWLRDLTTGTLRPLAGTTGGTMPFWSPDGRALGFFADGRLRSLDVDAGRVQDLAAAPSPRGGAWHSSGDIVFAPLADGALMRRAVNGAIEPFTTLQSGESSHRFPHVAGDRHVVFFVRAREPARQGIWIAARDQPDARRRLANSDAEGFVVDATLLYASGDALVARRLNPDTSALEGGPQLLGSTVGRGAEHQLFATLGGEVLLFGAPPSNLRELRWLDGKGTPVAVTGEPMNAAEVRVAPSGDRVAVARADPQLRTFDIWLYEDQRPVPRRLSTAIDADESPAWSPDGTRVVWVSGRRRLLVRDARAEAPEVVWHEFENPVRVSSWSPNGQWVVLSEVRSGSGADILLLAAPRGGSGAAGRGAADQRADVSVYAQAPFNETSGAVSPDGRWLAYASDESGTTEVYVDSFPTPGHRARLSVGGGTEPRWAPTGTGVFFRRGADLHLVGLALAGRTLEASSSQRVFTAGAEIRAFDVAPDGQRFLVNVPAPADAPPALTALVHFRSLLPSAP